MRGPAELADSSASIPPRIVGRERELAIVRDAWAAALAGQGGVILLIQYVSLLKTRDRILVLAECAQRYASIEPTLLKLWIDSQALFAAQECLAMIS